MFIQTGDHNSTAACPCGEADVNQRLLDSRRGFRAYFGRKLGNPQDAEDAFQNFSLKVIRAAQTQRDSAKIDAWLWHTMRNTLIDHYRRNATRKRAETAYAQEIWITANEAEDTQADMPCKCLYAALPRLKASHAAILRRADLSEEPRNEIATDLGLTANALNVRLHRARQALKAELQRSCPACRADNFLDCDCE